jgi:hypothetical protein
MRVTTSSSILTDQEAAGIGKVFEVRNGETLPDY